MTVICTDIKSRNNVIAAIAVAAVGIMILTGPIDWRRGAIVILSCFILFGATSIVAGIQAATMRA